MKPPNANAHAERFVRMVRPECLDHLLIVIERHLERVFRCYVGHYNCRRPHQGIGQQVPGARGALLQLLEPAEDVRAALSPPYSFDGAIDSAF